MGLTTTNLVCNLDASVVTGVADLGAVTNQLTDQSGHGNHATCSGVVRRSQGFNRADLSTIYMSGSSSTITVPALSLGRQAHTILCVFRPINPAAQLVMASPAGANLDCLIQQLARELTTYPVPSSGLVLPNSEFGGTTGRTSTYGVRMDTSLCRYYVNGRTSDVTHGQAAGTLSGNLEVGYWDGVPGFDFVGEFCEIAVYNAALSDIDFAANCAFLRSKWKTYPRYVKIFVGNSLSYGLMASANDKNYPAQSIRLLGKEWWGFNHGIASQTIGLMTTDDPARIDAVLALPDVAAAERVFVNAWEGTNTMHFGGSAASAFSQWENYYTTVIAPRPVSMIEMTVISRVTANVLAQMDAFNASVRATTRSRAVALLDTANLSPLGNRYGYADTSVFDADQTHLNDEGYQYVGAADAGMTLQLVKSPAMATAPVVTDFRIPHRMFSHRLVTLAAPSDPTATILYTLDGTDPAVLGQPYAGDVFLVTPGNRLRAVSVGDAGTSAEVDITYRR